jgi:hypothetical protein
MIVATRSRPLVTDIYLSRAQAVEPVFYASVEVLTIGGIAVEGRAAESFRRFGWSWRPERMRLQFHTVCTPHCSTVGRPL